MITSRRLPPSGGSVGQHAARLDNLGNNGYNLIHNYLEAYCYARARPSPQSELARLHFPVSAL